jgi:hypothetical protein
MNVIDYHVVQLCKLQACVAMIHFSIVYAVAMYPHDAPHCPILHALSISDCCETLQTLLRFG